ncbi:hypothetical protein SOVF_164160 isoform A [Spinacia oleracea]|nr:hypothetical protein SOVF_164160 isoform A [Spinacia oleracea]
MTSLTAPAQFQYTTFTLDYEKLLKMLAKDLLHIKHTVMKNKSWS